MQQNLMKCLPVLHEHFNNVLYTNIDIYDLLHVE